MQEHLLKSLSGVCFRIGTLTERQSTATLFQNKVDNKLQKTPSIKCANHKTNGLLFSDLFRRVSNWLNSRELEQLKKQKQTVLV